MDVDYIIAGQGLAGSLFAWNAIQSGKIVKVFDSKSGHTCTRVAAGIVTPITGRQMKLTWKAGTLIPFSSAYYKELQMQLGKKFLQELPMFRLLHDNKARNDWDALSGEPAYCQFMTKSVLNNNPLLKAAGGIGEIKGAFWIDTVIMMDAFRDYFMKKSMLIEEDIDISQVFPLQDEVQYKGFSSKYMVFCEGHRVLQNSYFTKIPVVFAKGEVLTIRTDQNLPEAILNKNGFLLPLGRGEYKIGATYDWTSCDQLASKEGKTELESKIANIADISYEVIAQEAGIRPTIHDKRPVIGRHPDYATLAIFNGMGTKGVSLAPYFAKHLFLHLDKGEPLLPEIDVKRFF